MLAADLLLLGHVLFVGFVVVGFALVVTGGLVGWGWVRNPWFRVAHLAAIAVVALQSWFGVVCPLTTWEMALRQRAGDEVYSGTFISHWLDALLYYEAPEWVFIIVYTAFALAVAGCWLWVRPRSFSRRGPGRR